MFELTYAMETAHENFLWRQYENSWVEMPKVKEFCFNIRSVQTDEIYDTFFNMEDAEQALRDYEAENIEEGIEEELTITEDEWSY